MKEKQQCSVKKRKKAEGGERHFEQSGPVKTTTHRGALPKTQAQLHSHRLLGQLCRRAGIHDWEGKEKESCNLL